MTKENKIIKDLKERNDKLNNQYRVKDIRCATLERQVANLEKENKRLKEVQKKLDCALETLAKWGPPCELNGFMDKHNDYCEKNCGVDEEVFKKCWLMYIEDKLEDEVE